MNAARRLRLRRCAGAAAISAQDIRNSPGNFGMHLATIASAPPTPYAARVIPDLKMKVVGRKQVLLLPEESFRAAMILIRQAEKLSPYPRPRGFVHKSRTYEDYTRWRRSQPNPWLW